MGKFSFDGYRTQWPRVGGVLAMAIGGAAALGARKMSKPQLLSALNFGALLVRQYEEHVDPGWFPGQFNGGVFKSDQPRNYPLSKSTALCVTPRSPTRITSCRSCSPARSPLGLSPAIFGIMQSVMHGVIVPRIAAGKYSPGFLASFFLHIPLGVAYIRALKAAEGLTRGDFAKSAACTAAFAVIGVAGPNVVGKNKNTPYLRAREQTGPHDVEPA